MALPNFTDAKQFSLDAKPASGFWTHTGIYVEEKRYQLKVTGASPSWTYGALTISADGSLDVPVDPQKTLIPSAPPGALIAKVGGSTAGRADSTLLFVIGSYCVFELAASQRGPLFLAMNVDPGCGIEVSGALTVEISSSG